MKKSNFNDEHIEKLLKGLPKVKDHRNPQEIFQNVSIQLERRKKRKAWVIPALATAAAAILFIILIPNLFKEELIATDLFNERQESGAMEEIGITSMEEEKFSAKSMEDMERAFSEESADSNLAVPFANMATYNAVYEEDLASNEIVITLNVPDQNVQNIVPVSFVVERDANKTILEQAVETYTVLDEEALGLADFYPLNASLSLNNNDLIVDVPNDHLYHLNTNSTLFLKALEKIGELVDSNQVILQTEGTPGVDLGNFGILETYPLAAEKRHAYLFYYGANEGEPYLVPSPEPYETIDEALAAMKKSNDPYELLPSIPEHLQIAEIHQEGDLLRLKIDENTLIPDSSTYIQTIEAILLTAKQFDFQRVIIESNNFYQFGKFAVNEIWNVPLAPNRKILNEPLQ